MIGKRYEIEGTIFEIVGDDVDRWLVDSKTNPDMEGISKKTLEDALHEGDAVEITD